MIYALRDKTTKKIMERRNSRKYEGAEIPTGQEAIEAKESKGIRSGGTYQNGKFTKGVKKNRKIPAKLKAILDIDVSTITNGDLKKLVEYVKFSNK